MMVDHIESGLNDLRVAATKRNWKSCKEASLKLLLILGKSKAVNLAIHIVEIQLVEIGKRHQIDNWAYECLNQIKAAVSSAAQDIRTTEFPLRSTKISDPVVRTLRGALRTLWRIANTLDDEHRCIELARDAVTQVFVSRVASYEHQLSPDLAKLRNSQAPYNRVQMSEEINLGSSIWRNAEVAEMEIALWLELANELERQL
jgi:hypothetical protein